MNLRITRKAKTVSARADERRLIDKTAKLAKQFGKKLVVSLTARKQS